MLQLHHKKSLRWAVMAGAGALVVSACAILCTWLLLRRADQSALLHTVLFLQVSCALLATAVTALAVYGLGRHMGELSEKAAKDELTGVGNRRCAIAAANDLLGACSGADFFGLFLVDVDHFKAINDQLGHAVGDATLQRVAAILRTNCRQTDLVCRMGGDEFMLLMPYSGSSEFLHRKAEVLCRELQFGVAGGDLQVSCSVGMADTSQGARDFATLYQQADAALYHAKQEGRCRCAFHGQSC